MGNYDLCINLTVTCIYKQPVKISIMKVYIVIALLALAALAVNGDDRDLVDTVIEGVKQSPCAPLVIKLEKAQRKAVKVALKAKILKHIKAGECNGLVAKIKAKVMENLGEKL